MASTYSTSLKLTLIGDGDQSGIWGQTTNTNLGTLLEQAITGVQSITMLDANYTLTNFNGVTNEARNAVLVVTGTNNAIRDLIPPVVEKLYTIVNNTAGGYAIRVIGGSGTGVNIPNGATCLVYCDGTNFVNGLSGAAGNFSITHGIAVGIGMQFAIDIANRLSISNQASSKTQSLNNYLTLLLKNVSQLGNHLNAIDVDQLFDKFESDKKHTDKHFVMILPDKNGLLTKVSVNKEASFKVLFKESFKLIQETYEI